MKSNLFFGVKKMKSSEVIECLDDLATKIQQLRSWCLSKKGDIISDFVIGKNQKITVKTDDETICVISPKGRDWRLAVVEVTN